MRSVNTRQSVKKLPYRRPELTEKGSVVELTQQVVKDFGLTDGYVLLDNNTPLTTVS